MNPEEMFFYFQFDIRQAALVIAAMCVYAVCLQVNRPGYVSLSLYLLAVTYFVAFGIHAYLPHYKEQSLWGIVVATAIASLSAAYFCYQKNPAGSPERVMAQRRTLLLFLPVLFISLLLLVVRVESVSLDKSIQRQNRMIDSAQPQLKRVERKTNEVEKKMDALDDTLLRYVPVDTLF